MITTVLCYSAASGSSVADCGKPCRVNMGNVGQCPWRQRRCHPPAERRGGLGLLGQGFERLRQGVGRCGQLAVLPLDGRGLRRGPMITWPFITRCWGSQSPCSASCTTRYSRHKAGSGMIGSWIGLGLAASAGATRDMCGRYSLIAEIGACRGRRRVLRGLHGRLAELGRKASTSEDGTLTRRCQRCERGEPGYRVSESACLP